MVFEFFNNVCNKQKIPLCNVVGVYECCFTRSKHHKMNVNSLAPWHRISVMCVTGLFFIPVIGLTGFHIVLVVRGRTTNEQVKTHLKMHMTSFTCSLLYLYLHAFIFFLFVLSYIMAVLFAQVTGKFRGGVNPFTRGCCGNIQHVLCSPLSPRWDMNVAVKKKHNFLHKA